MKKSLLTMSICFVLAGCQNFYVLPALGNGANAPFVNLSSAGVSVAPTGTSGGGACVAQATKACVGCSVSCATNRQPICIQGKDPGLSTSGVAVAVCAQESRCRCE